MGIIYSMTMYRVTVSKDETDIKKAIIQSDRFTWDQIERKDFKNRSNARIFFEGRRDQAQKEVTNDGIEVTFFLLSEEQIGLTGSPTRIEVIDIAVPK